MPIRKMPPLKRPRPLQPLLLRLYLRKLLREEPWLIQDLRLHRPVELRLRLRLHRFLLLRLMHQRPLFSQRQSMRMRRPLVNPLLPR